MHKIYPIIVLSLGTCLSLFSQSASLSRSSLSEVPDFQGVKTVTVTLSGTKFVRKGDLSLNSFHIHNGPSVLSITRINVSADSGDADVDLDAMDFDINYPDFYISIDDTVLLLGDTLNTGKCRLIANVEFATLSSNPSALSERNIGSNGSAYLDITLDDTEYFVNNGNDLVMDDISLRNFPAGVVKHHIDYGAPTSSNKARLHIYYDPSLGDIDADFSNAALTINAADLQYSTDTLGTSAIKITGLVESVYSSMADNQKLEERSLDTGLVVLTLVDDLVPTGSIPIDSIELINFPTGTSIQYVEGVSGGTKINVYLNFNGQDFDSNVTNARVRVKSGILKWNTKDDLITDAGDITITAFVEVPGATISAAPALEEYNLDGRIITVNLSYDSLTTPFTLSTGDLTLLNAPAGLSVGAVSVNNAMEFEITLAHIHNDFDVDNNLGVSINHLQLNEATSDLVSSNTATIYSYLETPVAHVTPNAELREVYLDSRSLLIRFEEEKFSGTAVLSDFGLVNGPAGLSIDSVSSQADSSITLLLAFNGTDFDIDYSAVRVSIKSSVLDQTESGFLLSPAFLIQPNIEAVVGSVSMDNTSMKIGAEVPVTINLSEYEPGSGYTLAPLGANIGGYALGSLLKVNDNLYTARFTVAEFGNDYPDSVDIPVSKLRLDALPVNGVEFNGMISQDSDLLDANRPRVSSLYVVGQEPKKVGDRVVLLISAFEEGLLPEDSTEINKVLMTEDNVVFEEIGGGTYSLLYTIEANDQNVASGGLKAKIYLRDPAGNLSTSYPAISTNTLSIDASVPIIYSVTNTTPSDTVIIGGEVILTVLADGSGYKLSNTSEVNGVRKNEGLIFSSTGTAYTIRYPVRDIDPTVLAGDLKARIILEDAVGNGSVADTVILNNDVAIFTKKPTARFTLGDEICIYDTATLYMSLSGSPPWKIKYRNASDFFYVENISTENFSMRVHPEQTLNYTIDSVWDGTGNANIGFGNAIVIVNPLPVVNIVDLDSIYAITDTNVIILNGDPTGGDFFGPGVNSANGTFTPSKAGLTGTDPHRIFYEFTDSKLCFNADTHLVRIVDAAVNFTPARPVACYLDQEYILEAYNTASSTGSFSIVDNAFPGGFIKDNGDNTVTFNPSILPWVSGQDYMEEFTIRYDYLDGATPLNTTITLEIEYFDTAYIKTDLLSYDSCSYDTPLPLTGSRSQGIFSSQGGGVIKEPSSEFVFNYNPGKAVLGENWIVYTYESNKGCKQYDSAMIMNYEVPDPGFEFVDLCVPLPGGGIINFQNISDVTGLPDSIKWEWNFGDIQSGVENEKVLWSKEGVSHKYSRPGERTVTLTATVAETGCHKSLPLPRYIGNTPDVSVEWNTECFTTDATDFRGSSLTEDGKSVYNWMITDLKGTLIRAEEGPDLKVLQHKFDVLDNYRVRLTATSDSGCVASAEEIIYLRPYISYLTDTTPYFENFESDSNGWFAFSLENSANSWTVSDVDPGKFPYDLAGSGNKAWYTDSVNKKTVEQSWVTSPCFDFSGMRRPMISLDRKISSDRNIDGAVLQYTYNDGKNWRNVGAVDDGSVNWYNTFRISDGPGGQGEGWTGGFIFDGSEPWKNSRHDLDALTGRVRVQFRIAYSSAAESILTKEGFAFDNVWIGERSRVVLLEHFTNASVNGIAETNRRINQLVQHNPLDLIDIQFHAEVEGSPDRMNEDNPSPASARSLFYGTRKVPYTLLDGGMNGEMAYDFTVNNDLDTLDLASRALDDPSFSIDLNLVEQSTKMDISIGIEALESLPSEEYIVYTVIIEKHINDAAYLVPGADTAFQNVVRDMVPNAAGISLIRAWEPGDKENITLSWQSSDIILKRELVNVVVFIQGAENKMVYQAASNDPELNGDPVIHVSVHDVLKSGNIDMRVYPNPASSHVYIVFAEPLTSDVEIQLFTHTGSLVQNKMLIQGTGLHELSLSGLLKGMYFIRAIQHERVIGTQKLLIMQ